MAEVESDGTESKRPNEVSETVQFWLNEIGSARKREKDWRKDGKRIRDIYDGSKADETPFNILFSNTETMAPALYSTVPRPVVERRFKDDDPIGKAAAIAGRRMLEFLLDTNVDGYETFNDGMKSASLDALLPGRGVTSVKYDAEIGDADGTPVKTSELVCVDSRSWDRVFFGFARKWSKVPWVAFEEHMDRESAEKLFGADISSKIEFTTGEDNDDEEGKSSSDDERDQGERKTALVYQIWDKENGRKIRYISPHYKEGYLLVQDDPLGLTGFYNCPRPLQFVEKSNDLKPVSPYILYENQAKELNRLTRRINRIAEAIKARGIYDSSLGGDIENVMKADDNALVPSDKSSSLAAEKGMQNAIWFLPLQELIVTHEKLLLAREQCKQTIYEITGISDIIRGSTKASETLGAQQLKSQWGTLRIKPKQAEVQRYARDLLRIMLEMAATKFSEDTWARMTGLPYLTEQQVAQGQAILAAAQQSGQQPPPQIMQAAQQPQWKAVLDMLRDDMQRAYRIDIETNSTVEPEAVEDQKNIADLMTAMGQFLNGVGPLVEKGIMPFETAQTMLLSISRRYRFGQEIEDQIKQMQPPKQEDDGEAQKAAQQAQAQQQQLGEAQGKIVQLQTQLTAAQKDNELIARKSELDLREAKLNVAEEALKIKEQVAMEKINSRDQIGMEKLTNKEKVVSMAEARHKESQANASRADSKIGQGLGALKQTASAVEQARSEMLAAIEAQGAQTQAMVKEILNAIRAPRVRVPVRGPDGRISHVIDGPQDAAEDQSMPGMMN
ncbi:MAG TPA: hypothetical protein PLF26_17605 [Blastocatellia bacterium]|nr:hypothetical protein [Blastocatellia bacterium]